MNEREKGPNGGKRAKGQTHVSLFPQVSLVARTNALTYH